MISENISESLLHQMCCGVTSCDLVSSYGIDLKTDLITRLDAHRESGILRIDNMEIAEATCFEIDGEEYLPDVWYDAGGKVVAADDQEE